MPAISRTEALGEPVQMPHRARWWIRAETLGSSNEVTGTTLSDGGLIKGYLHRQISTARLDEHGLRSDQAGEFQMPVKYGRIVDDVAPIKIGDELQIGGQRWQVITSPITQDNFQDGGFCAVMLKSAEGTE